MGRRPEGHLSPRALTAVIGFARAKPEARVDQRLGFIMTLQDGKIVRTESYSSVQEARKAAGLSEQDVQANSS
jgi:ketosteroid isomerase-like protein